MNMEGWWQGMEVRGVGARKLQRMRSATHFPTAMIATFYLCVIDCRIEGEVLVKGMDGSKLRCSRNNCCVPSPTSQGCRSALDFPKGMYGSLGCDATEVTLELDAVENLHALG
jgi:hypothetical protein